MEKKVQKEILKRLIFFRHFSYFPLKSELYKFLRTKVSYRQYEKILKELVGKGKVKILKAEGQRLFLENLNSKSAKKLFLDRVGEYRKKISDKRFIFYLKLLKSLPQIKFVGLSGSLAWGAAGEKDDIDLFLITKKGRLWTGRFLAVILAFLLGIKRKRGRKKAPGKVCLNLFFEEGSLKVPKIKQNEYVAFELLALRPLFDKGVYEKLLEENKILIKRFFPNVKIGKVRERKSEGKRTLKLFKFFGDFVEKLLKSFQLFLINRHKTCELITSTQLWFFPEDFEKKYKKLKVQSAKFKVKS